MIRAPSPASAGEGWGEGLCLEKKLNPAEKHKPLTVGLLWHSLSSDNLGVGALTVAHIVICREAAKAAGTDIEFIVFGNKGHLSYSPADIPVRQGSPISPKQMLLGKSKFVAELGECDLVLDIGEGDSFSDIYGLRRYITHVASKIAVLRLGKPLILSPQTIGPFKRWTTRRLATAVMKRCTRIFARDGQSAEYLRVCGVVSNIEEVVDVAFRLPFIRPEARASETIRIGPTVAGVSIISAIIGSVILVALVKLVSGRSIVA